MLRLKTESSSSQLLLPLNYITPAPSLLNLKPVFVSVDICSQEGSTFVRSAYVNRVSEIFLVPSYVKRFNLGICGHCKGLFPRRYEHVCPHPSGAPNRLALAKCPPNAWKVISEGYDSPSASYKPRQLPSSTPPESSLIITISSPKRRRSQLPRDRWFFAGDVALLASYWLNTLIVSHSAALTVHRNGIPSDEEAGEDQARENPVDLSLPS